MIHHHLRKVLVAGVAALSIVAVAVPAYAQWIVYDPTNFSQNVLTAARELQQVNNQIQSLENQATMLINQAKNLASLPYSSVAQLEASIQRTEQLLTQAQRIAYSVTTIDQAFTQIYPQNYSSSTSSQQLLADAQTRWQNALRRLPGCHARPGRRGAESRQHAHADQRAGLFQPVGHRRASGGPVRQPAHGPRRRSSSPTSPPSSPRWPAPRAWMAPARWRRRRRPSNSHELPQLRRRLSARPAQMFH